MVANNEVSTGIEQNSDVTPADADIFAFADDGEYATVWEVDRLSDSLVRVNVYRCEAGLSDHVAENKYSIDRDKSTEEWAREHANVDPDLAVELARDYWGEE